MSSTQVHGCEMSYMDEHSLQSTTAVWRRYQELIVLMVWHGHFWFYVLLAQFHSSFPYFLLQISLRILLMYFRIWQSTVLKLKPESFGTLTSYPLFPVSLRIKQFCWAMKLHTLNQELYLCEVKHIQCQTLHKIQIFLS